VGGAEWVRWIFVAIFAALVVFYVVRLFACGRGTSARGLDISRGVMSLGMVAMVAPRLNPLPALYWQLLFSLAAAYIAVRLIRRARPTLAPPDRRLSRPVPDGHHHELHLLIGGVAMVHMLAAMPVGRDPGAGVSQDMVQPMAMAQMGSAGLVLTWAFVAYFLIFVVRLAARLAAPVPVAGPRGVVVSPHLLGSTEIVMGIGMSYMLLMML
jgi:Domain of unknown function (DUF5134)